MTEARANYQIGQSVRVVRGQRNNTPRRGTIRLLGWHYNDRCIDFFIQVCDKAISKRYRDEDLIPDVVDPSWLSSNVIALARAIRSDQKFDRLPILADALQDAGCADDSILEHCQSRKPHRRKCWVVELLLGDE